MTDALKAAIAAIDRHFVSSDPREVITASMVPAAEWGALRAAADALAAQPAAEPVAWMWRTSAAFPKDVAFTTDRDLADSARENGMQVMPLYAAQPARAGGDAITMDWASETKDPLAEFDAIAAEYDKTAGTSPGAEMAHTMRRVRAMLEGWFAWHREAIRAALAAAPQPAAAELTVPLPLTDAQHLLSWMDAVFGNEDGEDWHDADAASVADGLGSAVARFKRAHPALAASVEQPAASTVPATDIVARHPTAAEHSVLMGAAVRAGKIVAAPAAVEREALDESGVMKCLSEAGCYGLVKLTYESGPYDIDRPTDTALRFARAIEHAHGIGSSKEGGSSSTGGGDE